MDCINLTCPINNLGYGVTGFNILKALCAKGVNVCYWPIGQPTANTEQDANIINECVNNASRFNPKSPSLRLWHQHDMAQHIGGGERIGFPIFELTRFSDIEKHQMSTLDKIIVCSEWAKSIVENEVPGSSVYVAPLGVDSSVFNAKKNDARTTTVFLNIGKWEIRKGHDILVDAFNTAFTDSDDVELWMMNHNPFLDDKQHSEWNNLYLNSNLGSKIKILPRVQQHQEVANIMQQADAGVFPSRAEGWNLEALEMMAMGKYVILTNYSAHTEFATDINSKLIHIDETEDAYDGIWFNGQGQWASFGDKQMEQLVSHMKSVHSTKQTDYSQGRNNRNERGLITGQKLTWSNCADKIIEAINS